MPRLTAKRLRQLLRYDQDTGIFTRLVRSAPSVQIGDVAGSKSKKYVMISVDGHLYRAHRLAHLYMTGRWPARGLDHRDTDTRNNRWRNLRPATKVQNARNAHIHADNVSGFKGVVWHKKSNKWWARITVSGRTFSLGLFGSAADAHAAYCAAAAIHFGEFARAA